MTMNEFFQGYEIVVMQDNKDQGSSINSMSQFQSHPEFNGEVHIFAHGEQESFASILTISKASLVKAIKSFKPGLKAGS